MVIIPPMESTKDFSFGYASNTFYVMAVFPLAIGAAMLYAGTRMSPAALWYGLGAVTLLVGLALAYNAYATNHMTLRVTGDALEVDAPLRKRAVARSEIKLAEARRVDLTKETSLVPTHRKNGSDVSGLKEGWWQLKNGEKALVVVTNPENAVYIPTTAGYSLLVTPTDPSSFLTFLRH